MKSQDTGSHANGIDSLSLTLIAIALLFLFLGKLASLFSVLAVFLLFWGIWRTASHKLAARQAENYKFLHITGDVRDSYERWRFHSQHCYSSCEQCGAKVAATPDLGEVTLICPNCGHHFTAHT